jgi:hypothetical protein
MASAVEPRAFRRRPSTARRCGRAYARRMAARTARAPARDTTVYPEEETVGEESLRSKRRGLVRVVSTDADRVVSRVLGCHLVAVGSDERVRLRLGTGPEGRRLVETPEEELARVREEAKRERARLAAEIARLKRR